MNKITFPLTIGDRGTAVADLQDGLRRRLEKELLLASDPVTRAALAEGLAKECSSSVYGEVTCRLVVTFQDERRLKPSGEVDEATAAALNAVLDELGAFSPPGGGQTPVLDARCTLLVRVLDGRGKPIPGLRVEAYHKDPSAPPSSLGEPATTDRSGQATVDGLDLVLENTTGGQA